MNSMDENDRSYRTFEPTQRLPWRTRNMWELSERIQLRGLCMHVRRLIRNSIQAARKQRLFKGPIRWIVGKLVV